jgi:hypothetical protein
VKKQGTQSTSCSIAEREQQHCTVAHTKTRLGGGGATRSRTNGHFSNFTVEASKVRHNTVSLRLVPPVKKAPRNQIHNQTRLNITQVMANTLSTGGRGGEPLVQHKPGHPPTSTKQRRLCSRTSALSSRPWGTRAASARRLPAVRSDTEATGHPTGEGWGREGWKGGRVATTANTASGVPSAHLGQETHGRGHDWVLMVGEAAAVAPTLNTPHAIVVTRTYSHTGAGPGDATENDSGSARRSLRAKARQPAVRQHTPRRSSPSITKEICRPTSVCALLCGPDESG